jgi:glyoxylase I family protein
MRLRGLHHVTAICRDLESTIAFYRDTLGLAIVRDAPSDDDPDARHLWFDSGNGTFISFMEYGHMPDGIVGIGSTHHFALRVETRGELQAWRDYLRARGIATSELLDRGAFHSVYLRDPDGHVVEIATQGPVLGAGEPST